MLSGIVLPVGTRIAMELSVGAVKYLTDTGHPELFQAQDQYPACIFTPHNGHFAMIGKCNDPPAISAPRRLDGTPRAESWWRRCHYCPADREESPGAARPVNRQSFVPPTGWTEPFGLEGGKREDGRDAVMGTCMLEPSGRAMQAAVVRPRQSMSLPSPFPSTVTVAATKATYSVPLLSHMRDVRCASAAFVVG